MNHYARLQKAQDAIDDSVRCIIEMQESDPRTETYSTATALRKFDELREFYIINLCKGGQYDKLRQAISGMCYRLLEIYDNVNWKEERKVKEQQRAGENDARVHST